MRLHFTRTEFCWTKIIFLPGSSLTSCGIRTQNASYTYPIPFLDNFKQIQPDYIAILSDVLSAFERQFIQQLIHYSVWVAVWSRIHAVNREKVKIFPDSVPECFLHCARLINSWTWHLCYPLSHKWHGYIMFFIVCYMLTGWVVHERHGSAMDQKGFSWFVCGKIRKEQLKVQQISSDFFLLLWCFSPWLYWRRWACFLAQFIALTKLCEELKIKKFCFIIIWHSRSVLYWNTLKCMWMK